MKKGEKTRQRILDAGLKLWRDDPQKVNSHKIANEIGITHAAVLYHFFNAEKLKTAIAKKAIEIEDVEIIFQLIAIDHSSVAHFSIDQKNEYIAKAFENR